MMYKTIVLELLQDQYPALHEHLRTTRTLLATLELQAAALKRDHEAWMDRIAQSKPHSDPAQTASEAMELALEDLMQALSCASMATGDAADTLFLDAAMAFIRRATPSA